MTFENKKTEGIVLPQEEEKNDKKKSHVEYVVIINLSAMYGAQVLLPLLTIEMVCWEERAFLEYHHCSQSLTLGFRAAVSFLALAWAVVY